MSKFQYLIENDFVIETNRLRIYPFKLNMKIIRDLYEIYSSRSNTKDFCTPHLNGFMPFAEYFRDKFFRFQKNEKCVLIMLIESKQENKAIGVRNVIFDNWYDDIIGYEDGYYTSYQKIAFNRRQNVISEIVINEKYWNSGYAFEASEAIFKKLKESDIENVLTFISESNNISKLLDEKLGFKEISEEELFDKYGYLEESLNHTDNPKSKLLYLLELQK